MKNLQSKVMYAWLVILALLIGTELLTYDAFHAILLVLVLYRLDEIADKLK